MQRHKQILRLLRDKGPLGLTVKECMELGGGTELRKVVSDLIKPPYECNITDRWEYRSGRRFKRYFLNDLKQSIEEFVFMPPKTGEIILTQVVPVKLSGEALKSWNKTRDLLKTGMSNAI